MAAHKAHLCARNNVSRLTKNVNIPVKARDILWNGTQSARPSLNHHMGARQSIGRHEVVAAQGGWSIPEETDKALTNGENRSQGRDMNPHSGRATCLSGDGWQWRPVTPRPRREALHSIAGSQVTSCLAKPGVQDPRLPENLRQNSLPKVLSPNKCRMKRRNILVLTQDQRGPTQ
jgi:hypothetical protein